ncbi:ABC transporter permease [Streptomyces sp. DSM 44915]|uniref:ABC transporter permease n=1 Tax=Streptomyces chisholmiae TaxID=3075540 RepID=A0ABU2JVQ3_9ACTN|nr:ABC transporter permease [Streptomyces sp. DSM 44915]MDT0268843.1 ABC transporter permease [Streptomyces sp. DSM 44915]
MSGTTATESAGSARPARAAKPWDHRASATTGLLMAAPLLLGLALFVGYPLLRIFLDASSGGDLFGRYAHVLSDGVSQRALFATLRTSAVVVLVATVLGTALAWTLHVTERRWVRVVLWTVALVPFWLGVIVKNYSIYLMLSANGPVNSALRALGLADEPVNFLYTQTAIVVGIAYSLVPYAVLSLYSAFMHIDKELLHAAQALGASRVRALATVAFPLARGGVAASMALVFVLSIGFYVTPILLGGAQTPFMATQISQQIFNLYDYPGAAASAAVLLLIAVLVVGGVFALVGGRTVKAALR